jgi:predicted transcriptional regulator of viral defense system
MKNRSLSSREYKIISELASRKMNIVSINEISKITKNRKNKLWDIVYRLEKKGWLEKIEKGKYMLVPLQAKEGWLEHPLILASNLVKKYYISYRTALAHYGLTEQIPIYIYIATTERKGNREKRLQNYVFKFIRIKEEKFFGFKVESIGNNEVFIAKKEKAVIDCLDKERYAGSILEIIKALNSRDVNVKILKKYALKMNNSSLNRRLGYLLDLLNKDYSGLEKHIGTYRNIYLSTLLPKKTLEINKKWKIIVNLKEEELLK